MKHCCVGAIHAVARSCSVSLGEFEGAIRLNGKTCAQHPSLVEIVWNLFAKRRVACDQTWHSPARSRMAAWAIGVGHDQTRKKRACRAHL